MPRYFFNVRTPDELQEDFDGLEFENDEMARHQADIGARDIIAEKVRLGLELAAEQFEVIDEQGHLLFVFPMRSVLKFPD